MKRGYVDIPEGQVHYRSEGNGDPVVLLHCAPASSNEFALVIPILGKTYRAIGMDALGCGNSDRAPSPYAVEDYARSVVSFLDALGIEKANLAGHHVGANIASEVAIQRPDRVRKLVLSGCPCFKQPEEGEEWVRKYEPIQIKADGSHLMKVWDKAMFRFPPNALELAESYTIDYLMTGLGHRGEEGHTAAFKYDASSRLPLLKTPTLLLWGDKDVLYVCAAAANRAVPNGRIKIIPGGTSHYVRLMPREWAGAVMDFLERG